MPRAAIARKSRRPDQTAKALQALTGVVETPPAATGPHLWPEQPVSPLDAVIPAGDETALAEAAHAPAFTALERELIDRLAELAETHRLCNRTQLSWAVLTKLVAAARDRVAELRGAA
jgi:hypothetical protein